MLKPVAAGYAGEIRGETSPGAPAAVNGRKLARRPFSG
jgi:hypothetical protein